MVAFWASHATAKKSYLSCKELTQQLNLDCSFLAWPGLARSCSASRSRPVLVLVSPNDSHKASSLSQFQFNLNIPPESRTSFVPWLHLSTFTEDYSQTLQLSTGKLRFVIVSWFYFFAACCLCQEQQVEPFTGCASCFCHWVLGDCLSPGGSFWHCCWKGQLSMLGGTSAMRVVTDATC